MYRICEFGEETLYETLEEAEADIRSIGPEWTNVSLVEDTDGLVFDVSDGRVHVGERIDE